MKWLVDLPLIAALVLPIVLPPHVETFTTDKRHGRRAASELGGGSPTSTCPFRFAEESFASSVRDSVHRLSLEHRPLLVHTRNDVSRFEDAWYFFGAHVKVGVAGGLQRAHHYTGNIRIYRDEQFVHCLEVVLSSEVEVHGQYDRQGVKSLSIL